MSRSNQFFVSGPAESAEAASLKKLIESPPTTWDTWDAKNFKLADYLCQRPAVLGPAATRFFYACNDRIFDSRKKHEDQTACCLTWYADTVACYDVAKIPAQVRLAKYPSALVIKGAYVHRNVVVANANVPEFFDVTLVKFVHGVPYETCTVHMDPNLARGNFFGLHDQVFDAIVFVDRAYGRDWFLSANVPWTTGFRFNELFELHVKMGSMDANGQQIVCGLEHLPKNCSKCNMVRATRSANWKLVPSSFPKTWTETPRLRIKPGTGTVHELAIDGTEFIASPSIDASPGLSWADFKFITNFLLSSTPRAARPTVVRRSRNGSRADPPYPKMRRRNF